VRQDVGKTCGHDEETVRRGSAGFIPTTSALYGTDAIMNSDRKETALAKVLVLYYSSYGHIETMARAVADGAREAGADVDVKRVPETAPPEVVAAAHFKTDHDFPEAQPDDLTQYDAIIVGVPTRYGNMASQMAAFWDRTGGLWAKGALIGKVGGVFASSATQHGGNEATILSVHKTLLHHGLVIVGLPYAFQGQMTLDEIAGGSPYGATTIAAGDGSRQPSQVELDGARFQGRHIAQIAGKLVA
jgi:NAD(P)H dehydrogenase (quinone)